jgi:type II secretory pathway pseudopilin PulG
MKSFLYSLVVIAVISLLAAYVLNGLELSSAEVFKLKNVRL